MDHDNDIWIIVPALNEAEALTGTLTPLCNRYKNIVLVDDGSTDDTECIARRYPVYLVQHALNRGQGAALQTGLDFALQQGAEILVTFDADGQHAPQYIENLVRPITRGDVDITLGSRFLGHTEGMPTARRLVLRSAIIFTRFFSRIDVTDTHNGMRAFSRKAALRISIQQDGMAHASEILDEIRKSDLRFQEIPVGIHYCAASLKKG